MERENHTYIAIDLKSFMLLWSVGSGGLIDEDKSGCGGRQPHTENNLSCSISVFKSIWDSGQAKAF